MMWFPVLWNRILLDPELLSRSGISVPIRIQQKRKEQKDKNFISNFRPLNSGLPVQYV